MWSEHPTKDRRDIPPIKAIPTDDLDSPPTDGESLASIDFTYVPFCIGYTLLSHHPHGAEIGPDVLPDS